MAPRCDALPIRPCASDWRRCPPASERPLNNRAARDGWAWPAAVPAPHAVGADVVELERDHAGSMSAIDHGQDALPPGLCAQLARGQDHAGRRKDVAEEE